MLAHAYGRYGYRGMTALLQQKGWRANHKRVARLWRQEGLKVPQKQPKRARLWFADGSCIRRRAEYPNHVWSYDFVMDPTQDWRTRDFSPGVGQSPLPPPAASPASPPDGRCS